MADESTSLRARRAQLTRDEILIAARRLFAERGYSRTSVRDIARAAGVSAQTVYDSIGSKRALVARLNDVIDVEAGVADIARRAAEASDPHEIVITGARITRSILEHCGDIIRALVTGAAAEPDLAAVLDEGHRRHLAGAARTVETLDRLGALAPSLEQADAVESLAAVTDFRFALVLRDDYDWSLDRIENWIASISQTLLLET